MEYIKPLGIVSTEFIAGLFSSFWPINISYNEYGIASGPDQYAESSQSQTKSLTYTPNTNYGLSHWECTGLIRGTASGSGNVLTIGADARGILDVKAIFGPIVWNISSLHSQISTTNTFLNATGTYNSTSFTGIIKVTDASAQMISAQSFYNAKGQGNGDWDWWSDTYTIPNYFSNVSVRVYGNIGWTENLFDRFHGGAEVFVNGSSVAYWPKDRSHESYSWTGTLKAGDQIQVHMIGADNKTRNEREGTVNISVPAQTYASMGMANGINTFNINTNGSYTYYTNIVAWGTNKEYKNTEYTLSLSSPVSYNSQNNLYTSDHGW